MSRLAALVVAFLTCTVSLAAVRPVQANASVPCPPAATLATWETVLPSSSSGRTGARLSDGSIVTVSTAWLPSPGTWRTSVTVAGTELTIPGAVSGIFVGSDDSVWFAPVHLDPPLAAALTIIPPPPGPIHHWTGDSGLVAVPNSEEITAGLWRLAGVRSDGRAFLEGPSGVLLLEAGGATERIESPAEEGELWIPWPHVSLIIRPSIDSDDLRVVDATLVIGGDEQDISDLVRASRGGIAGAGPHFALLVDQSVYTFGSGGERRFPIHDPEQRMQLVGITASTVFLVDWSLTTSELFSVDRATGVFSSLGFGPVGADVDVTFDEHPTFISTISRNEGAVSQSSATAPSPSPYVPQVALSGERSGQVERIYRAILGRDPDQSGAVFWRESGAPPDVMVGALLASDELADADVQVFDSFELVDLAFRNVLGRSPTANERALWSDRFARHRTQEEALLDLLATHEFLDATNTVGPSRPLDGSLTRLYTAYFDRAPDEGGLCFWTESITTRQSTLAGASAFFEQSPEFIDTYGELDDAAFVELVYRNVLRRTPDEGGAAFWLEALRNGLSRGDLMLLFAEAPEFRALTDTL